MLWPLPAPLLLATWVAVWAAPPTPEPCESEMNKVKDLLEVDCADRGLDSVPVGLPQETGILLLASNQLAWADLAAFQHLPQLSELDLSNNSLVALETGAHLPNLRQLLLSHNVLKHLPAFPGLPGLQRLTLGHNQLSALPEGGFRGLGQLRELELQGNQLQNLPSGAFQGLAELRDLDLSDNRLEALPAELLAELSILEILRLERNGLRRLPEGFFLETDYAYVYLAENPWRCDCRLVYLRDWIRENELIIYTRTTVQEGGSDKEITENEPLSVQCQAPPQEKGQPILHFEANCRRLDDELDMEEEGEEEEGEERGPGEDSGTSSPTSPPTAAATTPLLTTGILAASVFSSHGPSTATGPPGAALPTPTSTSAVRSMTTPSPTTTGSLPPTALTTTAATGPPGVVLTTPTITSPRNSTTRPSPTTTCPLPPIPLATAAAPSGLSTTGATAGPSTATSNIPRTTRPSPRTIHAQTHTARPPPTTTTSSTPPAQSPTTLVPPTPLPPSAPPSTMPAARHPLSTAALAPVEVSPNILAPVSPCRSSPPPSAHCLCPTLPVRVLGVSARKGSPADWLSGSCCLLRLALYLACLVLVALPTLALLCRLGWLYLSWHRLALRGAPGSCLLRPQPWQRSSPQERRQKPAEALPPASRLRIYRVCKTFQLGPSRHVTWLLVSLPGSAGKRAPRQAGLSSYSLDRGGDALGAVRVKYATASL